MLFSSLAGTLTQPATFSSLRTGALGRSQGRSRVCSGDLLSRVGRFGQHVSAYIGTVFPAPSAGRRSARDHVSGAMVGEVVSEELAQQVGLNGLGMARVGSSGCPRATVAQDRQILAGVGLAEVERQTAVADAERVVVRLNTIGRLTRLPSLCCRPRQWVGANLETAVRMHPSARR
jgi:hypothetical protein